jgi:hypothetical protein
MAWTPTPYSSVFGLWLVFIMALCVWFGTTLTNTRELYAGLAAGAAVSSGVAVLQYFGVSPVPVVTDHAPAGLYVNSVQQGTVLVLIVVALASERMWLWAVPLLPGIALSGSRGALLALAIGLLGCYVRHLWVFGIVAAAGVAYMLLTPFGPSDQMRAQIWAVAYESLTLYGWGPGVFYTILLPQPGGTFYPEYAHNDALQLFFEYGIAAVLPIVIVAFALSRTGAREWPIVLAFVVAGCYSMPLWMPIASFLALVAVGRILRGHALLCSDRDGIRRAVVSWGREFAKLGGKAFPVAPRDLAKG